MPSKKRITPAERRYRDYLRHRTLRVASVYERRLAADRRKELRKVLARAKDYTDPAALIPLLQGLDETAYLGKWWQGLYMEVGLPQAKAVARDMREAKAAEEDDVWLASIRNYATTRAGNEIRVVSGTWRDSLVRVTREVLAEDAGSGVEKITKEIYRRYTGDIERWQVRRIAQTEAMIGMAEAGAEAARTLDIPFTKQWAISGLGNTRESHEAMDGVTVDQDEPFVLPGGLMMYPHDTSMNAAAGEIINCACDCIRRPKNGLQPAEIPSREPVQEPDYTPAQEATPAEPPTPAISPEEARIAAMMAEMPKYLSKDTRRAIALNNIELEKALGIKKGKPMSVTAADRQSANPKYIEKFIPDENGAYIDRSTGERFRLNPKYPAANKRYHVNCATCTPAYFLRERGFDITAKGRVSGSLSLNDRAAHSWCGMWKNVDGTPARQTSITGWMGKKGYYSMTPERYKEFFEEACKEKGTYAVGVSWRKGGGHATIFKRESNGKLVYIEPQHYQKDKGVRRSIDRVCKDAKMSGIPSVDGVMRLDDKLFDTSWAGLFDVK